MKVVWILILSQILLFSLGGCASEPTAKTEENSEPPVSDDSEEEKREPDISGDSDSHSDYWEDTMALLNELKDIVLEQEGLYNIHLEEDGTVTVEPREDIQVELDTERVRELMEDLDIYAVYVRPEEEYFGYIAGVEFYVEWYDDGICTEICYSTAGAPGYLFENYPQWEDLGDGWYSADLLQPDDVYS